MADYICSVGDITSIRKGDVEEHKELHDFTVAFVFPNTFTYGKIYYVREIEKIAPPGFVDDPIMTPLLSLREAVEECFDWWRMEKGSAITCYRWRLFIRGRFYGPIVPEEQRTDPHYISMTPGYQYFEVEKRNIIEHVLYWEDMDKAFCEVPE